MKKLITLITLITFTSCNQITPEENAALLKQNQTLTQEIENMTSLKTKLQSDVNQENEKLYTLQKEVKQLENKKSAIQSNKPPRYIIKVKLKQSSMTLNLDKHVKDAMNAITFELPVDKQFYDSVKPGESIVDEFRNGSFIMNGSLGKWKMKVESKRIVWE